VLRSDHQRDSAAWIHRLAVRRQREAPPARRPSYAQRPKPSVGDPTAEAILSAVPGISSGTARALLRHFGSVAAVLQAGPDELLEVPGVGRERARLVSDAFKHHWDGSP
jgi:ERCC4-type nuclease